MNTQQLAAASRALRDLVALSRVWPVDSDALAAPLWEVLRAAEGLVDGDAVPAWATGLDAPRVLVDLVDRTIHARLVGQDQQLADQRARAACAPLIDLSPVIVRWASEASRPAEGGVHA